MYKPSTYIVVTYFPTYLPIYEAYFSQNWLPRWNQILTQLSFIHNWVITGILWMDGAVVGAGSLWPHCSSFTSYSWKRFWFPYHSSYIDFHCSYLFSYYKSPRTLCIKCWDSAFRTELQHFILRFSKISLLYRYHLKRG
jgi:hypothetical protein